MDPELLLIYKAMSDITDQVVELLKECYTGSPEVGTLKITAHKNKLSSFVADPLLWVRLLRQTNTLSSCPPNEIRGAINPICLKKRLELLKAALKKKPDLTKLTSNDRNLEALFAVYLADGSIISAVDTQPSSSDSDECLDDSPTHYGIITELWKTTGGEWCGAVTSVPTKKNDQTILPAKGYRFDPTSPMAADLQLGVYPLHIGDEISFSPDTADPSAVARGSLQVTKYNTMLDDTFVARYLEWLKETPQDECLLTLLSWLAPWTCAVNDEALYSRYYADILTIYGFCTTSPAVVERDRLKNLIALLSESQFTFNIAKVLSDNKDTVEDTVLSIAVTLLCDAIKVKNDNNYLLADPIKELGKVLARMQRVDLMQSLVVSLVDTHCVPTDTAEATPQTWHHLPIIPTNKEFQSIISLFKDKNPKFDLPVVKVKDAYSSTVEYGHTYFSLLRADCYYPLCEKIARLKAGSDQVRDSYYQLMFTELVPASPKPVLFGFRFKGIINAIPQPDDPPSLTHGNLLCISVDGRFVDDLIWATVEDLDSDIRTVQGEQGKLTKEGSLHIQLCSDFNTLPDEECMEQLRRSMNILAVESPAYFRAYQPVLHALKELDLSSLHFKDDFLSPTALSKSECNLSSSEVDPHPLFKDGKDDGLGKRKIAALKEIDPGSLCLDPSQMDAICQSLTLPVSLIQGPPGTGKTYVGAKLMQLFLSLSGLPKDKPILIMAFRNKALDHFLEECLKFGIEADSIVRVGSYQSTDCNDALWPLLLNTKVRSKETERNKKLKRQLHSLNQRIIEASRTVIEKSKLTLENCREYMTAEWLKSLLLKGPHKLSEKAKDKLTKYPERCLELLLKGASMMGGGDRKEQEELTEALERAWNLWSEGVVPSSGEGSIAKQQNGSTEEQGDEVESRLCEESQRRLDCIEDESETPATVPFEGVEYFTDTDQNVSHRDVWNSKLSVDDKRKLIVQAVKKGYTIAMECLKVCLKKYEKRRQIFEAEQQKLKLGILQRSKVVGMTTTGAAINQQLLNELKAQVVFVEEAAEVLESNLLASLTPHVEHLILIGDHMQLKPKVACSRLEKNHKFDTSLFLRLVEGGFPHTLLMRQSRMRHEMVGLYGHHYKEQKRESNTEFLQSNFEIVKNIASLGCMATSVYWWDHTELETSSGGGQITNSHEVKMVVSLSLWILSHGDKDSIHTDDITILTPYRAQMKAIKNALKDKSNFLSGKQVPHKITTRLSQLKVQTVDEFQGHESKVIILSLVRNNTRKSIGFLSDKNRQVVAMSRQKCGLYIVGNSTFLSDSSPFVWKPFIANRQEHNQIGNAIPLTAGLKCSSPEKLEELICNLTAKGGTSEADGPVRALQPEETTPSKPPARQQSSPAALLTSPVALSSMDPPVSSPPVGPPGENNSMQAYPELALPISTDCMLDLSKSAVNWRRLGRRLKLKESVISTIEIDFHVAGQEEMFYQMLMKWTQERGKSATYKGLIKALEVENLNDLVESVKSLALQEWTESQQQS